MRDPDLDRIINDLRARREQLSRLIHDATSALLGHSGHAEETGQDREPAEDRMSRD